MTGSFQGDTRTTTPGGDLGEQHAHELADKIRLLAATDPGLAQELVDQLIVVLDQATGGSFREHLCGSAGAGTEAQVNPVRSEGMPAASIRAS